MPNSPWNLSTNESYTRAAACGVSHQPVMYGFPFTEICALYLFFFFMKITPLYPCLFLCDNLFAPFWDAVHSLKLRLLLLSLSLSLWSTCLPSPNLSPRITLWSLEWSLFLAGACLEYVTTYPFDAKLQEYLETNRRSLLSMVKNLSEFFKGNLIFIKVKYFDSRHLSTGIGAWIG